MAPSITIKLSNGSQHVLQLPEGDAPNCSLATITINDLKVLAAGVIDIPPGQQRMVYRGKVLKGDSSSGDVLLSQFGVEDGHTIHVVKGQAASPVTPSTSQVTNNNIPVSDVNRVPESVTDTQQQQQPVNPYAAIFGGGGGNVPNPNISPQTTGQGFGSWPPMGMDQASASAMLNNPMAMQAATQMMQQNPQMMQQIMASNPMMANLPPAEREMISSLMQNPQMMDQMMSVVAGQQQGGGLNSNSAPQMSGINPLARMMGGTMGGGGNPSAPPNPREAYSTQLEQLQAMGFPNENANIAALQMSNGNVEFAIEKLLNSGSGF